MRKLWFRLKGKTDTSAAAALEVLELTDDPMGGRDCAAQACLSYLPHRPKSCNNPQIHPFLVLPLPPPSLSILILPAPRQNYEHVLNAKSQILFA